MNYEKYMELYSEVPNPSPGAQLSEDDFAELDRELAIASVDPDNEEVTKSILRKIKVIELKQEMESKE